MKRNKEEYEFPDYTKGHPLQSDDNKKVVGKFKDEMNGRIIHEFIGLKPKMYSMIFNKDFEDTAENEELKKAKGVSTRVVKKELCHDDYKQCLLNSSKIYKNQIRIGQVYLKIFTFKQNKTPLNAFDGKRYIWNDGVSSYAYGHHLISLHQE